ncbi:MAG: DUF3386 family protein [bacterium]|nr:DUF3386 family protein [bacterium]
MYHGARRHSLTCGLLLAVIVALPASASGDIDLTQYFPLQDGDSWTYQFRAHQPDGQVKYSLKTYRVDGEVELEGGEVVKKLVDQRGWYYMLTIEPDRYLHWGEHENKGLVSMDPPFALIDTRYAFGKPYATAHAVSDGSARGAEVVFEGYESIRTPAGEFKNCLKSTFKYINPNGSTFTSATYLAKGVGPVRKEFAIYSPRAGQILRFDRDLLHATIGGQRVGGRRAATVEDLGEYFPFFQGDSWTYQWTYTMADGASRSAERTRTFAGAEFFDRTAAFKLIDNKGSYQFYTYHPEHGIRMHGSFENRPGGEPFTYQPALSVARPDQVIGREYTWSEPEANQPEDVGRYKRLQHWTSEIEGYQTLETPAGTFEVLRVRLAWSTSKSWVSQWYYLAKHAGIVGMDYEAVDKTSGKRVIALDARLKRARLRGDDVASLEALAIHVDRVAESRSLLKDDPKAREIFKAASQNRYVWDDAFPGLRADVEIVDHGGEMVQAKVTVDRNLIVDFECDDCGAGLRSLARAQISQFVTHRANEPFDEKYGEGKAFFQLIKERPDGMYEIRADGETAMGSWYLIDGKEVRKLTRTLGGPVRFMIHHEKNIRTEDGRYIANYYPVTFFMEMGEQRHELGKVVYDDQFVKQGDFWLPKHRILKGKLPQPDRSIIDVDLEMQFVNVAYLN